MPKSNTRITVALLMLIALFAAVWAGAHGLLNPFADTNHPNSEKSEKNLVSRSPSTSVKAVSSANNPPSQPAPGPISSSVISGGGGSSSGGSLTLDGTVGETSAATQRAAGTFTLDGGFWNMPQDFSGTVTPTTVQFGASVYLVGEGDGHATITVTRAGDLSGATTVDYKTTDTDNFTVGCADKVNNFGSAYGRCDFATVVGTASFAAGETTKTFAVPIIDDFYAEGNETFGVALSNPSGATLSGNSTATVTITDNETSDGPNPIFQTNPAGVTFFVRQHYLDFLGREPEQGEPWSAILNGCANQFNTDPNNPSAGCDRIIVSGSFFGSPEFSTKGIYIIDFYRAALNRLPTYVEFSQDLASVTGATGAETNAKRATFATNFVLRPEFTGFYGSMNNTNFVNALMSGMQGQNYNLTTITTPDPANPNGTAKMTLTTSDLTNGLTGSTLTRAQVLRAIVQSDQITQNLETVNAFVASQYYGYLRRSPDTAGFNNWVNYLKANPNDFRTMVNGFVNSNEYRLRFGPL